MMTMSPFRSKAQMRKFAQMVKTGEISQNKFNEWLGETSNVNKLPERISKKKTGGSPRKKEKIKSIKSKSTKNKRVYISGSKRSKSK